MKCTVQTRDMIRFGVGAQENIINQAPRLPGDNAQLMFGTRGRFNDSASRGIYNSPVTLEWSDADTKVMRFFNVKASCFK